VNVISLAAGEPGAATAPHIVAAAENALRDIDNHHYGSASGLLPLRAAIADRLHEQVSGTNCARVGPARDHEQQQPITPDYDSAGSSPVLAASSEAPRCAAPTTPTETHTPNRARRTCHRRRLLLCRTRPAMITWVSSRRTAQGKPSQPVDGPDSTPDHFVNNAVPVGA
jgi:hypothetical protein